MRSTVLPIGLYTHWLFVEPIVTIAQPVVHNGNLVGVVGTDITVAELFFFKKLLNRFEKSYLFVMRRQDNVVFYHPLLPHPALDGSSLVYQIELLEREADKQGILAQMEKYAAVRLSCGWSCGCVWRGLAASLTK